VRARVGVWVRDGLLTATSISSARSQLSVSRNDKHAHTNTCARAPHLAESDSGPTGDMDSSWGELPVCTSWSRLLLSFLSSPASLPGGGRATAVGGCLWSCKRPERQLRRFLLVNLHTNLMPRGPRYVRSHEYASRLPYTTKSPVSTFSRKELSLRIFGGEGCAANAWERCAHTVSLRKNAPPAPWSAPSGAGAIHSTAWR
jgi:hypothetical protein